MIAVASELLEKVFPRVVGSMRGYAMINGDRYIYICILVRGN